MTKYLLAVACCDLKWESGSSAKVTIIDTESGEEKEVGHTDMAKGVNPIYRKMLDLTCNNPESDLIKVAIHDEHDQSRGVGTFTVAKIKEHPRSLGSLNMSADRGTIVVHVTEKSDEGTVKLTLSGKDLKNVEGFTNLRKSDPFYILSRPGPSVGDWTEVYKSEVIDSDLNPKWSEVELEIRKVCNGDFEQPLKIDVYDKESFGKDHKPMGSLITCPNQLFFIPPDQGIALKTGEEKVGDIMVAKVELNGCVDSKTEAKELMESVAIALQTRTEANARAKELEAKREELNKAKEALAKLQLEVETVEDEWSKAMTAAKSALTAVGGL